MHMTSSHHLMVAMFIAAMSSAVYAGCSRPATADVDPREYILRSWGDHIILPQYATFEADAGALARASETFCEDQDLTKLAATRDAWKRARVSWKRLELYGFGPHVEFPERYASKIDFWPAREDKIEETLTNPTQIASLENAGTVSRGFPVIEYLLFAPGDEQETLTEFDTSETRCDYLVAATQDLSVQAQGVHDAWHPEQGAYMDTMLNPQDHPDGMFMDRQEAVSEIVNRMAFLLDNIRRDKLGKPAGEKTGEPSPDSVESRYSAHSVEDIRANLDMVEWLFQGPPDQNQIEEGYWLKDHPRLSTRDDIKQDFDEALHNARGSLDKLDERPLKESSTTHNADLLTAIDKLGALQRVIQIDVINALSLTRTFNDSDGD